MAQIIIHNCQIAVNRVGYANGDDLRRLQEYLAACGPSSFLALINGMGIVEYALLDQLAVARDLGIVELVDGKYQLAEVEAA